MLTELNQLLTESVVNKHRGRWVVDLGYIGDPSIWCGLWTLDIEDPSVCSIGRQMSPMINMNTNMNHEHKFHNVDLL